MPQTPHHTTDDIGLPKPNGLSLGSKKQRQPNFLPCAKGIFTKNPVKEVMICITTIVFIGTSSKDTDTPLVSAMS